MAFTAYRTWAFGELVTVALMNEQIRDNGNVWRGGGIAITSQAALDFIYASSGSQFARLAKGTTYQAVRLNSGASAYEFFSPWRPRYTTVASASSITPNFDTENVYDITALAASLTINTFGGTLVNGEFMQIRIKDNGTARALVFSGPFASGGPPLPTTTVAGKRMWLLFQHWSGVAHHLIAAANEP